MEKVVAGWRDYVKAVVPMLTQWSWVCSPTPVFPTCRNSVGRGAGTGSAPQLQERCVSRALIAVLIFRLIHVSVPLAMLMGRSRANIRWVVLQWQSLVLLYDLKSNCWVFDGGLYSQCAISATGCLQHLIAWRRHYNMSFIYKLIEKVVATQLSFHLDRNGLLPIFQPCFRQGHSLLVCLISDIFGAIDKLQVILLSLFDVSTVFDTVDHTIL